MQTEKLFYSYAADKPYAANIIAIQPWKDGTKAALVLDKTIFYPEGGGQPGDRGFINGYPLVDVQETADGILHIVPVEPGKEPVPGPAELILDAKRRRDLTVQHSAQHLLSGILLRMTGGPTVSMHLGDEATTIDVDRPQLPAQTLLVAEEEVAKAIEADLPIIVHLCPPEDIRGFPLRKTPPQGEEVIRVIEIRGQDHSPCCGTHCSSTGQIAMLRILGAEKHKGMTRISFIAGRRVLVNHRMLHENAQLVSRSLTVPLHETGRGTLALLDRANALERRIKEMQDRAAESMARPLVERALIEQARPADTPEKHAVLIESYPDEDIDEVLRIGRAAQKLSGAVFILASRKDLKFAAFCSAKDCDIRPLFKGAFEKAQGRGGGSASFFQGQFASGEDMAVFIAELREKLCT